MAHESKGPSGPNLTTGVTLADFSERGTLLGHVGDDDVLLVRDGADVFAIGARCTHYKGPLAEGLVVGRTVHCPWHHACFHLETGRGDRPALDPVACWRVERQGDRIVVRENLPPAKPASPGVDAPEPMALSVAAPPAWRRS
jgi:nitrite reductase/ring-hydroxylating ferredoxin subunit